MYTYYKTAADYRKWAKECAGLAEEHRFVLIRPVFEIGSKLDPIGCAADGGDYG